MARSFKSGDVVRLVAPVCWEFRPGNTAELNRLAKFLTHPPKKLRGQPGGVRVYQAATDFLYLIAFFHRWESTYSNRFKDVQRDALWATYDFMSTIKRSHLLPFVGPILIDNAFCPTFKFFDLEGLNDVAGLRVELASAYAKPPTDDDVSRELEERAQELDTILRVHGVINITTGKATFAID